MSWYWYQDDCSMQLWLAHRSEVSIREQLATQIVLGILSPFSMAK